MTEVFRNRVVDYMSSHENEFEGFVEGNFNDYLKNMRKPGTWGDEPEIKAISFMLQIGINVRNVHGELILKCNESCNVEIQLSYVDISDGEGSGNHYKFALEANIIKNYRSLRSKNKDQQSSPFRNIENSPTRRRNIITSISPGRENSPKKRKYSDSFEESIKDSSIFSGKTSTPLKNQESIEINKVIGISPIKLINENSSNTLCTGEFKKRRRDDSGINLSQRLDNKSNHSQKKLSSKSNQSKPLYLTIISDSGFVSNLWDESNNSQQSSKTYKRQLSFKEEKNNRSRKKLVVIQHPAHSVKKVNSFKLLLVK